MGEFDIGQPVPRTEDPRLLSGRGRYLDDVRPDRLCHAVVLRSPHAHAEIRAIGVDAARAAPGVLAVLTGEDYRADGFGNLRCLSPRKSRGGGPMYQPETPPLAVGRVRFVGDGVALVVAETVDQARDAAEMIAVDYAPLDAVTDTAETVAPGAPLVWEDCPGNECFVHFGGDKEATDAAFARAAHVFERRFVISRLTPCTMEPRGGVGIYDPVDQRYTLYTGLHYPHRMRGQLATDVFGVPQHQVRVVPTDIGGSFGLRGNTYPELVLTLWASRRIGRPVKWVALRSEGLTSDTHGRDNVTEASLAVDKAGKFLGMRVRTLANLGAYLSVMGSGPPVNNLGTLAGTYTTPAIHVEVMGVFSHTSPTAPYRGAGRPEAAYVLEHLVEDAARGLGMDPAELRRLNTIPPGAMPFKTGLTFTYDCGEFERNLDDTLAMADYAGFPARRDRAAARGRLRGIGISNTIERAGAPSIETANIRFDPGGSVTLLVGTCSQGQGHDTVYKQILAQKLGISPDIVRVVEGDTDHIGIGGGTGGSRSATLGGSAISLAADRTLDKARRIAAHLLEAGETDLAFADGSFTVAGTDLSISLTEVAKAAYAPARLPADIEPGLTETGTFSPKTANYPNGCHVCEVEIDPDTGVTELVGYWVVDDVGTVLNPMLLKGQIHGGVAQGVGQAVMEKIVYEEGSGQLLSGSFMDYAMPRADDFCNIEVASNPVPTKTNPLGVKGAGEAGTVGALPAMLNAITNALAPLGVDHVPMPATPERLWRIIRDARET